MYLLREREIVSWYKSDCQIERAIACVFIRRRERWDGSSKCVIERKKARERVVCVSPF